MTRPCRYDDESCMRGTCPECCPSGWYWLSFADKSSGSFLGASIVGPVNDKRLALPLAHLLGCAANGEVVMREIPAWRLAFVPDEYKRRLLTRAECAVMDMQVLAAMASVGLGG